ncbi:MAG: GNAT family N-acetyltransferase, partial [Streptococcus sp.]|nr:GNAT family N-acetyltransferase [Streptococcus sp.]
MTTNYRLCYTCPMIIKHTRDTLSETYLDAVAIRN